MSKNNWMPLATLIKNRGAAQKSVKNFREMWGKLTKKEFKAWLEK